MKFEETEVNFASHDEGALRALWYRPDSAPDAPLVIDVHGGAWTTGHRKSDRYLCRQLAAAGISVFSIDFRCGPIHQHPAASEDIALALIYARTELGPGLMPSRIGLLGSSSGGHLALLSGLMPDRHRPSGVVGDLAVDFVVALWPVSNPLARYQYVQARLQEDPDTWINFYPDRLAEAHRGYFITEKAMQEAAIQRILSEKDYTSLPSVLIVQPEMDQNVPVFMSQTLHGALLYEGAESEYRLYPGVEHGFALADGPQTEVCTRDVIDFILR